MTTTTADYQSLTWKTAAIPSSDNIKSIRERSLNILFEMFGESSTTMARMAIINVLETATRRPHQGENGDDVIMMISGNTLQVLNFYKEQIATNDLPLMQKLEQNTYWQHYHAINDEIREAAVNIKNSFDEHEEYQIYKILMGPDSLINDDWNDRDADSKRFSKNEKIRNQKAIEFAENISETNIAIWNERILTYSRLGNENHTTPHIFSEFLNHFAKISPDFVIDLIKGNTNDLEPYFVSLLLGLWQSKQKKSTKQLIEGWVAAGEYLHPSARMFEFSDDFDEALLHAIFEKAVKLSDIETLRQIVSTVAAKYDQGGKELVRCLFLPAIEHLTRLEDAIWMSYVWYRSNWDKLLNDLDDAELGIVLKNLLIASKIDYRAEEVLSILAEGAPQKIIEFFGQRLKRAHGEKNKLAGQRRYEAIPFQLHKLQEPLSQDPVLALDAIGKWYDDEKALFYFSGGMFLKNIFPEFPEKFEAELLRLVKSGDVRNQEIVLGIIRNYEGDPRIHQVCQELIKILPEDSDLIDVVRIALEETGVMTGEFGYAETLERKREEVAGWLNHESNKVRDFATMYSDSLAKWAEEERKRAEQEIEFRKYEYGDKGTEKNDLL